MSIGQCFSSYVHASNNSLIDLYPGTSAAYSLRQLNSAYAGSAVRVRRDIDDMEMDIGFSAQGNLDIQTLNNFVNTPTVVGGNLPGDQPGLEAAYSLRKVKSNYSGAAIRVRRNWDNTEMDIGFDSEGNLDTAALEAFVNSNPVTTNQTLPLDAFPGAVAAFSIRKIRSAYTGNALEVHRVNDGARRNIGFDVDGNLNTALIESHCGTEICRVYRWYDQSGNNFRAQHVFSHSEMPTIYNPASGGIMRDSNGLPTLRFDGGNDRMTLAANYVYSNNDGLSVFAEVHPLVDNSGTKFLFDFGNHSTAGYGGQLHTEGVASYVPNDDSSTNNLKIDSAVAMSYIYDFNTSQNVYINNQLVHSDPITVAALDASNIDENSSQVGATGPFIIGGQSKQTGNSGKFFRGTISEFIIYDTDMTANQAAINGNIIDFYNLPTAKGYVTIWYDQSGNGHDAVQGNDSLQAEIYNSSDGINYVNKVPSILFSGREYFDAGDVDLGTGAAGDTASIFVVDQVAIGAADDTTILAKSALTSATLADQSYAITTALGANDFESWLGSQNNDLDTREFDTLYMESYFRTDDSNEVGFVNATQIFTNPAAGSLRQSNDSLLLGAREGGINPFEGSISEILIFNDDKSTNRVEIESNLNNYYKTFGNLYVKTWYDQSGNSNDAIQNNIEEQALLYKHGEGLVKNSNGSYGLQFDGVNDSLVVPFSANLQSLDFSHFAAVTPLAVTNSFQGLYDTSSSDDPGAGAGAEDTFGFGFYIDSPSSNISLYHGAGIDNTWDTLDLDSVNDDQILMLSTLRDSTNNETTMYRNKTLEGSASFPNFTVSTTQGLDIAKLGSSYFNGIFHELVLYNSFEELQRQNIENNIYKVYKPKSLGITKSQKIRRNIIRNFKIRKTVTSQLDFNNNQGIDFNELVISLNRVQRAKLLGTANLNADELALIDLDGNNTFNENDEALIREALQAHSRYQYADKLLGDHVKTNQNGEINFKSAKKFIRKFRRQRRKSQDTTSNNLSEKAQDFDCNEDALIDNQDKICALDFIRESLAIKYNEQQIKRFLKKWNFR